MLILTDAWIILPLNLGYTVIFFFLSDITDSLVFKINEVITHIVASCGKYSNYI